MLELPSSPEFAFGLVCFGVIVVGIAFVIRFVQAFYKIINGERYEND